MREDPVLSPYKAGLMDAGFMRASKMGHSKTCVQAQRVLTLSLSMSEPSIAAAVLLVAGALLYGVWGVPLFCVSTRLKVA